VRIPASNAGALREAASIVERVRAGTPLEDIFNEYLDKDAKFGVKATLQNDPSNPKFREFWAQASGAADGTIIGPVIMSPYTQQESDGSSFDVPPTWAVVKVLQREPPRPMTFKEAAPVLAQRILRQQAIDKLRAEQGVEIYEDKLWDPSGYGDQFKGQFIETKTK
jgi:hypothetical protein